MNGFCLINNVVLGLTHARMRWGLRRIAIIDIDAHFGNGTAELVRDDPDVFFGSMHLHIPETDEAEAFFPGRGTASEVGRGGNYISIGLTPASKQDVAKAVSRIVSRQSQLRRIRRDQEQNQEQDQEQDQGYGGKAGDDSNGKVVTSGGGRSSVWNALDRELDADADAGAGADAEASTSTRASACASASAGSSVHMSDGPLPIPNEPLVAPGGFRSALARYILPRLRQFEPELILISAGFDGMASDPLGGQLGLVAEDYAWVTRQIVRTAERLETCHGRVVSVLEGGYDISPETNGLAQAAQAHVRELMRAECQCPQ
jgi:acetoin utilization deacetylase AcuC-like enzyme